MSCGSNIKSNCGKKQYATCTYYETEFPNWSAWYEKDCVTIEDTTEELYDEVTELKAKNDFSSLTTSCSKIDLQKDGGVVTPKSFAESVLNILEEIKCPQTGQDLIDRDIDLQNYNLNYKCLVSPCGTPITRLSQLLQIMINKHCP